MNSTCSELYIDELRVKVEVSEAFVCFTFSETNLGVG